MRADRNVLPLLAAIALSARSEAFTLLQKPHPRRLALPVRRPASSSGDNDGGLTGGDDGAPEPWSTIPLRRPEAALRGPGEAEAAGTPPAGTPPAGEDNPTAGLSARVGGVADGLRSGVGARVRSVRDVGEGLSRVTQNAAGAEWSGAQDIASKGGSGVKSAAKGVRSKVGEGARSVRDVGSGMSQAAGTVLSGARDLASKGGTGVRSAAGAAWNGARSKVGEDVQSVQNIGSGISQAAGTAAGAAWTGARELASKGGSDVTSAAKSVGSGIADFASAASSMAGSAGSDLVGLVQQGGSKAVGLAQWMDAQAKDGAAATNAKGREVVLSFTGKTTYEFGDISKEVIRRASESNVKVQDILLVLKILLALGCSIGPLAKILPITVLLDMLNTSLEAELGKRIIEALGGAIDERFIAALSAEELGDMATRSIMGDAAKKTLEAGIARFTGKDEYKEGDIKEALMEQAEEQNSQPSNFVMASPLVSKQTKTLDLQVGPEFWEWDKAFRDSQTDLDAAVEESLSGDSSTEGSSSEALDRQFVGEFDEWDQKFNRLYHNDQR